MTQKMIQHETTSTRNGGRDGPAEPSEAGKSRARFLRMPGPQRAEPLRIRLTIASRITAPPSETDSAPRLNWL